MYMHYIIIQMHQLFNEHKNEIFAYSSGQRKYNFGIDTISGMVLDSSKLKILNLIFFF